MQPKRLRAIDLYSGVGGWALGLRLANIDVVASYEYSDEANKTNRENNRHSTVSTDIRTMDFGDLPSDIDIVVGSPPCTQFSFSNRGGQGDIRDGLEDVKRFLAIVEHLKPRWWVMENVPRVAGIIDAELGKRGRLSRFRHLKIKSTVVRMEDFGLPQRRRRCLVGNLDFSLLHSYATGIPQTTLGDVVQALQKNEVVDPLYGISVAAASVHDHEPEPFLNEEELRINRAGKMLHPVYNSMPFPDPLSRTVRTITATCTRVSRESVVIEQPGRPQSYRRLTIRERACLQGFPITYQFYGTTNGHKLKMVGNAVPPAFTFHVGLAMRGLEPKELPKLRDRAGLFLAPEAPPTATLPDKSGRHYPWDRTFRFAIPELRLKSGVRFELINCFEADGPGWRVDFYFGTSKSIHKITPEADTLDRLLLALPPRLCEGMAEDIGILERYLRSVDLRRMQDVWSHRGPGGTRPFDVLDQLGSTGASLTRLLHPNPIASSRAVDDAIAEAFGAGASELTGLAKLRRNAALICAGIIVGAVTNRELTARSPAATRAPHRAAV
jgi:DNA (cytosine-5)-methyltransferase 1